MTQYYFVRHGESTANVEGISAGWADVLLTDNGLAQALSVAKKILHRDIKFDMIISSPLSRAFNTAKIIAEINDFPVANITILESLKEKSSGTLEFTPLRAVYAKTEDELENVGGESARLFRIRVQEAINSIKDITNNQNVVLIVAHSGIYKMATVIHDNLHPASRMYDVADPKNADLLMMPIK